MSRHSASPGELEIETGGETAGKESDVERAGGEGGGQEEVAGSPMVWGDKEF